MESQSFELGAEELNGIADQSVDLAICIGAFEHMLDKRAMLASIYRKIGARFFCPDTGRRLRLVSDDSACVGVWNMHLSNDRILTLQESMLLDQAGFRRSRSIPWTFIPKGDVPVLVALLLIMLDVVGATRSIGFFSRRPLTMRLAAKGMAVMKRHIVRLAARANPSDLAQPSLDPHRAHVCMQ